MSQPSVISQNDSQLIAHSLMTYRNELRKGPWDGQYILIAIVLNVPFYADIKCKRKRSTFNVLSLNPSYSFLPLKF